MHHWLGSGKTNNLERFAQVYPGADIYLEGHTHMYEFFVNDVHYIDRKRNNLTASPSYFCTTAHFLDWKGGYGEGMKLKPGIKGAAMLELRHCAAGSVSMKRVRGD